MRSHHACSDSALSTTRTPGGSIRTAVRCASLITALLVAWPATGDVTFRLYEGITVYANNPDGKDFTITLDVRDLNLTANGPRETLFKVYDPDGHPLVRESIPDDGVVSPAFPDRIGGWDHELQYIANLYAKGTNPSYRWSAWSDPARLDTIAKRTFARKIKGGKKGIYRIVLAGTPDNYVSIGLTPDLKWGICGHPNFMHGHGNMFRKSYIYIPKDTVGIFFAATEFDLPRTRRFKLTAPDGKVLLDTTAVGGYASAIKESWQNASIKFERPGQYDGKLLTLEVSDGPGDYLLMINLQQPKVGAFKDYVGMGCFAVLAADKETAMAIKGGSIVADDLVFWHPFQVNFHNWLKSHALDGSDKEKARNDLTTIFNGFRLLETSDGRGSFSWHNWAYAMGYYGFKIFRPAWVAMSSADVPADVKDIIKEGLIMAGDRLSYSTGGERVNGNSFSQINVALWYCHKATGDAFQKERFEVFFDRWQHQGWGPGAGLSKSGDSQEHFAHDMHYGSYLMDNWVGRTWVNHGILDDAKDEPRFKKIIYRYRELYTYLYCREQSGTKIAANPWSARTAASAHKETQNWEIDGHKWKGEPGPDFTVNVNDGDEWFAARRKGYYALTFHGKLAPEWMSQCFPGQLGFSGGILCQVTIPGKGPVIASTLNSEYGEGMHPSNWRNFHINSIVGERWDGAPVISGICEPDTVTFKGNTISSAGEVRNSHVRIERAYKFNPDSIDCEASLSESDYGRALSIWSHGREWSEVKFASEMIPYLPKTPAGKPTVVTLKDGTGKELGAATSDPIAASSVKIDRGGFGIEIRLEQSMKVRRGAAGTILIDIIEQGAKAVPAEKVRIKYRIVPFGA